MYYFMLLVIGMGIGGTVQEWRYSGILAEVNAEHKAELDKIRDETLIQKNMLDKLGADLAQALIAKKDKRREAVVVKNEEVNNVQKSNPAKCKFDDKWVQLYNESFN